jgi:Type II secretion system (T2SS), protein M
MTTRDRLVVIGIAVLIVLAGGWLVVVSPERKKATTLEGEVTTARTQLTTAEGQLANARAAQARYSSAYASIVNLGKAVPAGREVPSLLFELAQASQGQHVDLSSIQYGASGGGASSASSASAASSTLAGFTAMPFTFVFNGSFTDLYNLFQQLNHYAVRTASGAIKVRGRLLTIQSAKLAPVANGAAGGAAQLSGQINATAYVLPASQGLTGGATPASPAGSASLASSSSAGGSSPATPAVARVTP